MSRSPIHVVLVVAALALLRAAAAREGRRGGPDPRRVRDPLRRDRRAVAVNGAGFGAPRRDRRLTAARARLPGVPRLRDVAATVVDDSTIALTSRSRRCARAPPCRRRSRHPRRRDRLRQRGPIATLVGRRSWLRSGPCPRPSDAVHDRGRGFGPGAGGDVSSRPPRARVPRRHVGDRRGRRAVASAGAITGTTPTAVPGADFTCSVTATFANGSCVASTAALPLRGERGAVLSTSAPATSNSRSGTASRSRERDGREGDS